MRKNQEEQGARFISSFLRVVTGSVAGLLVCLLFLAICAWAVSAGYLPPDMLYRLCVAGSFLGGLCGGLFALRGRGGRMLLIGLGTGVVFFLFLLMAGVLFFPSISPAEGGLGLLCGSLAGGGLAGVLGARPRRRKVKVYRK